MAIIKHRHEQQEDTTTKVASGVDSFTGDFREVWTVIFDQDHEPRNMAINAVDYTALPKIWDSHPADPYMYVESKRAVFKSALEYTVEINYSRIEDPTLVKPIARFSNASTSEPVDQDADENAITNSSDETYENHTTKDISDLVISIEFYVDVDNFDPEDDISDFQDAVNQYAWWKFSAQTCLIRSFTAEPERHGPYYYYHCRLEIHHRKDGWKKRKLDEGYRTKSGTADDGSPAYQTITDEQGNPMTSPTMLNGAGGKLSATSDPVFREHQVQKLKNFSQLPFDDNDLTLEN